MCYKYCKWIISIHTPHARRDWYSRCHPRFHGDFNPHASCEAWQQLTSGTTDFMAFQSTRLMRGVTYLKTGDRQPDLNFNPHASCEAWQRFIINKTNGFSDFNPHASCEAWHVSLGACACKSRFQSTRLMRGVTRSNSPFFAFSMISIHTPHARRDPKKSYIHASSFISIHTPHARRDR